MQTITNYNKNRLKLSDALKDFEDQIQNLVNDLDYYKKKENANDRYIFRKQQQILSLKNMKEIFIEFQENSNMQIMNYTKEVSKLNTMILKLEGICLYHGICNINYYLRMKTNVLILTVKEAFKNGFRQTPFELLPTPTNQDIKESQISHLTTKAKQLNINGK